MRRSWLAGLGMFVLVACGGGGGGGGGGNGMVIVRAQGVAFKGQFTQPADVVIKELRSTGSPGSILASGTTSNTGAFDLQFDVPSGTEWAYVYVTGGAYQDEATGASLTIPVEYPLIGFVNFGESGQTIVSPLSTAASALVQRQMFDPDLGATYGIHNAFRQLEEFFGVQNARTTAPADIFDPAVQPSPEFDLGVVYAGFSFAANGFSIDPAIFTHGFKKDVADDSLDGLRFQIAFDYTDGVPAFTGDWNGLLSSAFRNALDATALSESDTGVVSNIETRGDSDLRVPLRISELDWNWGTTASGGDLWFGIKALPELDTDRFSAVIRVGDTDVSMEVFDAQDERLGLRLPSGVSQGSYDLVLMDLDYEFASVAKLGVRVIDESQAPSIGAIKPAQGNAGTNVRAYWDSALPTTQVFMQGSPAQVVAVSPGRWVEFSALSGSGAVTIELRNGSVFAELNNGFSYVDDDVGFEDSGLDPDQPLLVGGVELGFSGENFFLQTFTEDVSLNGDTGTFTRTDARVTQGSTGVQTGTASGSTFFQDLGSVITVANFPSGGGVFFNRMQTRPGGTAAVGINGRGFTTAINPDPTINGDRIAGTWVVQGIGGIGGDESGLGTILGTTELDADGGGSVNVEWHARFSDGLQKFNTTACPLTYSFDGHGGTSLNVEGIGLLNAYFQDEYFYATGSDSETGVIVAIHGTRAQSGRNIWDVAGEYGGGEVRAGDEGDNGFEWQFSNLKLSARLDVAGGFGFELENDEGTRRITDSNSGGEFVDEFHLRRARLDKNGILLGPNWTRRGSFSAYQGICMSLGAFPDRHGFGVSSEDEIRWGTKFRVPVLRGPASADGSWTLNGHGIEYQDGAGDEIELRNLYVTYQFASSTNPILGSQPLRNFGTAAIDAGTPRLEKAVSREEGETETEIRSGSEVEEDVHYYFSVGARYQFVDAEDFNEALAGLESEDDFFEVDLRAEYVLNLNPRTNLGVLRDAGSRDGETFTAVVVRRATSMPAVSGTYSFGGFSHFSGNVFSASAQRGTITFDSPSAGEVTIVLDERDEFADGSPAETGSRTFTGTFTKDATGSLTVTIPGEDEDPDTVLMGALTQNGDVLAVADFSQDVGVRLLVGTRQTTSAPSLGNYRGAGIDNSFGVSEQTTTHSESIWGPDRGETNLGGASRTRGTDVARVSPFQIFRSSSNTVNPNGAIDLNDNGQPTSGAVAPGGILQFDVPGAAGLSPTSIGLQIRIKF